MMSALRAWLYRLAELFGKEYRDRQLSAELESHVQLHIEDNLRAGMPPEEARRQALLNLGGIEQTKEGYRDRRGFPWLESVLQDVRFSLRLLRKNPGFTAVAVFTLGLGIAVTTVMFTIVNGVLLKPLPYPQPDRLLALDEQTEKYGEQWGFSYPDFRDTQRASFSLASSAAWTYGGGLITGNTDSEYVDGRLISSGFFSVLGIPLAKGREFLSEEDRTGANPVIIISYELWQRRFASDAAILGRQISFDGKSYTVVGVTPLQFQIAGEPADVYTPLGQFTDPRMQNRKARFIHVLARLGNGLTIAQGQAKFGLIARDLARADPESDAGHMIVVEPLRRELVGDVRPALWLLFAAATLLLLVACVNLAGLLLSRAIAREREVAMRHALGASRARLVQQCLTESTILALCGAAAGLFLSFLGIRPFVAFWPGTLPRSESVQVDWRVLLFVIAISLFCGFLFGLIPALRAPSHELEGILRSDARMTMNSHHLHGGFVAAQIALALVLLFSAAILANTIVRASSLNPGITVQNVLSARIAFLPRPDTTPATTRAAWQDLLDHLRSTPGVKSAALADIIPMREGENSLYYSTTSAIPPINEMPMALATTATPDYLSVMGIRLRQGRFFSAYDRIHSKPVIVIDEVLAQHAFGGKNPVGQLLWVPALGRTPVEIVGVVAHVRHWGLATDDQSLVRDQMYYPLDQVPDFLVGLFASVMSVAVRTGVLPSGLMQPIERAASGSTGAATLYDIRTMDQLVDSSLARYRFLLLLFAIFAALGLLLACIGIYGVMSYVTNRRVREIGIRRALGAGLLDIFWLVTRQGLAMVGLGAAIGITGALASTGALRHFITGITANYLGMLTLTILALVSAALLAILIPAYTALRVDPTVALREE
jgi:predicted permease